MDQPSPFMRAALDAAESVRGLTSPNPWVGSVLVRDGTVVATGATQPPPGMHAEASALAMADGAGATMYVTLEPCAPFAGKRTPPCARRIIDAGITRVVVALEDPDQRVRGQGLQLLRDAGITVEVGDGANEAARSLRPYFKHRETASPYVVAKFAASLDGRTSANSGDSKWITGERSRERVHAERARVDAIMAGSGTVLADDPALTARPGGTLASRQPVRVLVDGRGRVGASARLFTEPGLSIVATAYDAPARWKAEIAATGATVVECEHGEDGINLAQLLPTLARRGIITLWVEGGGTLLGSLFDADLVDEVWAFLAPRIIGGQGMPAVGGHGIDRISHAAALRDVRIERFDDDILVRGYAGRWSPPNAEDPRRN